LDARGDVPGAPGLAFAGDGFGVEGEEGMDDDDVKGEFIEDGRLDHVELVEALKVEDALLRSPAELGVEPGRCAFDESNDAPMLF